MDEDWKRFEYRPACLVAGCATPALYKIAAAWSDGTSRELKNYGTVCATHRFEQLEKRARPTKDLASRRRGNARRNRPLSLGPGCAGRRLAARGG